MIQTQYGPVLYICAKFEADISIRFVRYHAQWTMASKVIIKETLTSASPVVSCTLILAIVLQCLPNVRIVR